MRLTSVVLFSVIWLGLSLNISIVSFSRPSNYGDNNPPINRDDVMARDEQVPLSDTPVDIEKFYKVDCIKEFYTKRVKAPKIDLTQSIANKTAQELRLMRYEVYARKGYLFSDAILRAHFNQFSWYQPIFDVEEFKVYLTPEEKAYIRKIADEENRLHKNDYLQTNGIKSANFEALQNLHQFVAVPEALKNCISKNGFALVPTKEEQLFYIYDRNHYQYIPSFITTDLYLQVLHMHLSKQIQSLEESALIDRITLVMNKLYSKASQTAANEKDPALKAAAEWNMAYTGMAIWLLTGKEQTIPASAKDAYLAEKAKIIAQDGGFVPSPLMQDPQYDYSQLQARGNYTRTDTLRRYFQAVKWLSTAPFNFEETPTSNGIAAPKTLHYLMLAYFIKSDATILSNFKLYDKTVGFLAGNEDNLSMTHAMEAIGNKSLQELASSKTQESILKMLSSLNPERIVGKGTNEVSAALLKAEKGFFMAGRYTFDAEIMQRLVEVMGVEPKRAFPKGLDIFASMGNAEAENLLLNTYKEPQQWPAFIDTLNVLKKQFKNFDGWNNSVYSKYMSMVLSMQQNAPNLPFFMNNPAWTHKNLNTMLASWTQLKHDMLLYVKQPFAAQAGQGGGPPPPKHISYVEPNLAFWNQALALLAKNEQILKEVNGLNEKLENRQTTLKGLASYLLAISEKQLAGVALTTEEHLRLSWIGGEIESMTLDILDSPDFYSITSPDKCVAIVADVYTYKDKCLEQAVGKPDEIYVVVEIDGFLYLARGAAFSHYEFQQSTNERLTDESWQKMVDEGKVPARALWYQPYIQNVESLKSKPSYSF